MIRKFESRDEQACRKIVGRCFDQSVILEERARQYMKNRYTQQGYFETKALQYPVFVFEEDGAVLGLGAIDSNTIKKLYIDTQHQGKGIGKTLLNHLEEIAIQAGQTELLLHCYDNARRFYQHQGYKEAGQVIFEGEGGIKIPATEMRKKLH